MGIRRSYMTALCVKHSVVPTCWSRSQTKAGAGPPKASFVDARTVLGGAVMRDITEAALREAFHANSSSPSHSKKRADVEALALLAFTDTTVESGWLPLR